MTRSKMIVRLKTILKRFVSLYLFLKKNGEINGMINLLKA